MNEINYRYHEETIVHSMKGDNPLHINHLRLLGIIAIVFFNFFSAYCLNTNGDSLVSNKEYYLELRGQIKQLKAGENSQISCLDSVFIKTSNEKNVTVNTLYTNEKGRCNFKLPLNKKFIIYISKAGFISKILEVNTKVPSERKHAYIFNFDLEIFEEIKDLDVSVLKQPIAKIAYDLAHKQFEYDIYYTNKINKELRKMYREYNLLRNISQQVSDSIKKQ